MKKLLNNGIALAFCTACISGISNVVNKVAVTGITDPIVHTTGKNMIVGLLVIVVLLVSKKLHKIRTVHKQDISKLIVIAIVGGAIPFYLYFTALSHMPVINASLIHKSLVFWVALLAIPLLGEKLHLGHIVGLFIIYIANYVLGSFSEIAFGKYEWMALTATLLWAVEQIVVKKTLQHVDSDIVSGARMIGGSLILLALLLFTGRIDQLVNISIMQWGMISLTSVFLLFYVMTWYRAIKINSVITVSVILTSATIITNVLQGIFLTHSLPPTQLRDGVLVLLGIFLFLFISKRHEVQSSISQS